MPAYNRGNESVEGYLVRLLTAIVRANGGELRVKGELIDEVNEATTLIKEWDKKNQELVLRSGMHSFSEVFRVVPVRPEGKETVTQVHDPLAQVFKDAPEKPPTPRSSTLDNPRLAELERNQRIRNAAALIREELRQRKEQREKEIVPTA